MNKLCKSIQAVFKTSVQHLQSKHMFLLRNSYKVIQIFSHQCNIMDSLTRMKGHESAKADVPKGSEKDKDWESASLGFLICKVWFSICKVWFSVIYNFALILRKYFIFARKQLTSSFCFHLHCHF